MSKPKQPKAGGRFAVMANLSEVKEAGVKEAEVQTPTKPDPQELAHFSSYLYPSTKKKIKFMALKESRRVTDILEDALADYMQKRHPNIPDDL